MSGRDISRVACAAAPMTVVQDVVMPERSNRSFSDIKETAREILDELWLGTATKPSAHLYPHQWSWDSAFIAIGNRHDHWDRAAGELVTLFDAQWSNGTVPHIVFGDTDDDYFPNAAFWDCRRVSKFAPKLPTSGICQPPVHATAVRRVFESGKGESRTDFVELLYPKLVRWHEYLHWSRTTDSALVEIWHPWESGMDNSPAWDGILSSLAFDPSEVPDYKRVDTNVVDAASRPNDAEYDRYAYLVGLLRQDGYSPTDPAAHPFRVRDVLFNSVLARAEVDLAFLGEQIGVNGSESMSRATRLSAAVHRELWDEGAGTYLSQDAVTGSLIQSRIAGGLMSLLAPGLTADRVKSIVASIHRDFLVSVGEGAAVIRTVPPDETGFDATRYWRGPTWIQMNWLVASALKLSGEVDLSQRLRRGVLHLIEEAGFYEYFDPVARIGYGTDRFGWTAALMLDFASEDDAR